MKNDSVGHCNGYKEKTIGGSFEATTTKIKKRATLSCQFLGDAKKKKTDNNKERKQVDESSAVVIYLIEPVARINDSQKHTGECLLTQQGICGMLPFSSQAKTVNSAAQCQRPGHCTSATLQLSRRVSRKPKERDEGVMCDHKYTQFRSTGVSCCTVEVLRSEKQHKLITSMATSKIRKTWK